MNHLIRVPLLILDGVGGWPDSIYKKACQKQGQICIKKYIDEQAVPWHSIKDVSRSDIL